MEAERPSTESLMVLGAVAGEIAHEVRNLLGAVATSAYAGQKRPAEAAHRLERIEELARRGQQLVGDLLALARGERLVGDGVSVREVVDEARTGLGATFVDVVDDAARVRTIGVLAVHLFRTLYENAAQVGGSGVTVTTRAEQVGDVVVVTVSDDGPGVPARLVARLFEPLTSGREGGTGLGLSLARRVAEAHGGGIEHVPAGAGATFRVTLPAA